MAEITYSGDFNGNTTASYQVTGGRKLPSNAIITEISYTLATTYNYYSGTTGILRYFRIGNASTGSPYADEQRTKLTSTKYTFSGTMKFDNSDAEKFQSGSFWVYARIGTEYSGSGPARQGYARAFTITVKYTVPSLTAPSNITITQHATKSEYNISWDAATGKNGVAGASVKYKVYYGKSVSGADAATNLVSGGNEITGTSISNISLPGYGLYDFKVEALYSGLTTSLSVAERFYGPSVTIPSTAPTISPTTGDSVTLSWGEGSYSYTSGDAIKYQVRYQLDTGSEADYSTDLVSGTSLTITSGWLEGKGAKDGSVIKFRVRARGGANLTNNLENKTYIYSDYTSYSDDFTYDGKYTVGYNDGTGWQACIVYYNDGTEWVECIPYYNDGTAWQPIKTKV